MLTVPLAQCVAAGAVAYCATPWLLWVASGSKAGPERQAVALLHRLFTVSRGPAA